MVFFVLGVMENSFAENEKALMTSDFSRFTNTDAINQTSVDILYRNHRRDLFYNFENESLSSNDYGVSGNVRSGKNSTYNLTGISAVGFCGAKSAGDTYLEIGIGFNYIKLSAIDNLVSSAPETKSVLLLKSKYQKILNSIWSAGAELNHDFSDGNFIQVGDSTYQKTAVTFAGFVNSRWHEKWKSSLRGFNQWLSDENKKSVLDFSTMYGISISVPWIWFGVGFNRLAFEKSAVQYWSPSDFIAYGPRLEMNIPIYNKTSLGLGANVNKLYDKDTGNSGSGFYFSGRIQYGNRNEFNVSLILNKIESIQGGNKWESSEGVVNVSSPF